MSLILPIDCNRRKQQDKILNLIELKTFRSCSSSIGWLGISVHIFCSLYSIHRQQKAPNPLFKVMVTQINCLCLLKNLVILSMFKISELGQTVQLSVLSLADASRTADYGHLFYIYRLLFGELKCGSIFYAISWSSHRSNRSAKSIRSSEILAACETIDEIKLLC